MNRFSSLTISTISPDAEIGRKGVFFPRSHNASALSSSAKTCSGNSRGTSMKFMVCFDGTNTSKAAVHLAKQYAQTFEAELLIVASMLKGTENERKKIQQMESDLDQAKKECRKDGISCESHLLIRGLSAGEDLIEFAGDQQIDQIFIGIRRRSKMEKLVFGSTAQYVILNAGCPVTTIK